MGTGLAVQRAGMWYPCVNLSVWVASYTHLGSYILKKSLELSKMATRIFGPRGPRPTYQLISAWALPLHRTISIRSLAKD